MADFNYGSRFNRDAYFQRIKFGADAPLLETELNELQEILEDKLKTFLREFYGDGTIEGGTISYSNSTLTILDKVFFLDGNIIEVDLAEIELLEGEQVFLNAREKEVNYQDELKKKGNINGQETVPNEILDERVNQETSRRIVLEWSIGKEPLQDWLNLELGAIIDGEFVATVEVLGTNVEEILAVVEVALQDLEQEFQNHLNDSNNPHDVTKSQIGLSNVQNYGVATQSEAEAGTSNVKYMTPLRTKQVVDVHANKNVTAHNVARGTASFAGNGGEVTIPHGLPTTPTSAFAVPTENPDGYLGEMWIRMDATNIYVGNSGSFTGEMSWTALC